VWVSFTGAGTRCTECASSILGRSAINSTPAGSRSKRRQRTGPRLSPFAAGPSSPLAWFPAERHNSIPSVSHHPFRTIRFAVDSTLPDRYPSWLWKIRRARGDRPQGTLELLILKTLSCGANHGFGITLHVQTVSDGLLRVEEGSLYPALHRMEAQKLVNGDWRVTENGRRARFYSLTETGKRRLAEAETNRGSVAKGVQKVLRFA
jgi:PadR family transcriptional regulator, regulatory protein PadR